MRTQRTTRTRTFLAAVAAALALFGAACSSEGSIDTEGDGVQLEGDVDEKDN